MKTAGWIGIAFGLLFFIVRLVPIIGRMSSLPEIFSCFDPAVPTVLIGVLFLILDKKEVTKMHD